MLTHSWAAKSGKDRVEIIEQEARVATAVFFPSLAYWSVTSWHAPLTPRPCHSKPFSRIEIIAICHCKTHLPGPSLEKPEFHLDQFYEAEAMWEKNFAQVWMAWQVYQGWGISGSKSGCHHRHNLMASWWCFSPSQATVLLSNHRV